MRGHHVYTIFNIHWITGTPVNMRSCGILYTKRELYHNLECELDHINQTYSICSCSLPKKEIRKDRMKGTKENSAELAT